MSAMTWTWVAPFGPDAEKILADAREAAFRERAYGRPSKRGQPRVKSLDALLKCCGGEGTCSIIDVKDLGAEPGVGIAGPFPRQVLEDALGTVRPSREQAEEGLRELTEHLGRGEAAYVVCYKNKRPHEVLFVGLSA